MVAKRSKPASGEQAAATTPEDQAKISRTPQTGYVNKADYFGNLVKLVSAEPNYAPNESELRSTTLAEKLAMIQQMNSSVIQSRSHWDHKKMARDKMLYADHSLIKTGRSVQKYVRAAYGLKSAEYSKIGKLSFTKPGA